MSKVFAHLPGELHLSAGFSPLPARSSTTTDMYSAGIFLSNLQGGGGHLRFWTFSKTNFGPFLTKDAKLWTFLYGV